MSGVVNVGVVNVAQSLEMLAHLKTSNKKSPEKIKSKFHYTLKAQFIISSYQRLKSGSHVRHWKTVGHNF